MMTIESPTWAAHHADRNDLYLAALLTSTTLAMTALVIADNAAPDLLPAVRWLALAPVVVAAYSRSGLWISLLVAAFFTTTLLPATLAAWATPGLATGLFDLLAYGVLLGMIAFLAAMVADFLRTRQALSGAVRDWETLLEATSEQEEVVEFVLRQAAAVGQARNAAILALNPVDGQWELFSLQGGDLERAPVTVQRNRLTLARWLIDQGRAQVLNTMPGDRRFMAPLTGASQVIHSLLAQPLSGRDGSLLAMIVLLNRLSGSFGEADFKALAALSEAAGRTLEQAGHYARTDHTLARRVQQLAALQRTARELNATMDPQAIADETLACAMAITAGDVGLVSVDVPGAGMVHHTWNVQVDSATIRRAFDLVHEAPHALLVPANDDSFYSLLDPPGLRLVAPIRRSGHTLGLILVESALPQAFGEEALRAVASLADHAAVALDNTRLFNEIVREKRTADEIVDAVADALFTVDAHGHVIAFNPAAVMLTGWRAEEAIGHLVCNVLGCQQGADCQQHCDVLLALQGGQRIEQNHWTIRQRLGTQRVVALSAAPLPWAMAGMAALSF